MRRSLCAIGLLVTLAGSAACGVRVYDEPRHDYHRWNAREERAYRVYLTERHREYVEFTRLSARDQADYWEWRHNHR